jgi:hypothetical protein
LTTLIPRLYTPEIKNLLGRVNASVEISIVNAATGVIKTDIVREETRARKLVQSLADFALAQKSLGNGLTFTPPN